MMVKIDRLRAARAARGRLELLGHHRDVAHFRLGGRAGVAGCHEHFGYPRRLRALPGQRVLATAGTHDQNFREMRLPLLAGLDAALSAGNAACR